MGRNKTRKKNQRSGQVSDDQDPDVSEAEPSSSENISASLNDTVVLSSTSNNVMDTDVEDSEQTTGDSTPADETNPGGVEEKEEESETPGISVSEAVEGETCVNPFLKSEPFSTVEEESSPSSSKEPSERPSTTCTHIKGAISMPGLRKALKSDLFLECASRSKCIMRQELGAGDGSSESSKEVFVWCCLQCGNFGCGDCRAQGGDAEAHVAKSHSVSHNIAVKVDLEMDKAWCFQCKSFVDSVQMKEPLQTLRRNPKLKLILQSTNKTGPAPVIALGPPPPPPQPETTVENNQFKQMFNKNKMNNRNKPTSFNSNWDNSERGEWPMGLENLGNTCFMNSALQCMSRTKSLSQKLDLYGTGNTIEILVSADPPTVEVIGPLTPDTQGETAAAFASQLGVCGNVMDENSDSNHVVPATESENGGSSPSSSDLDSLLDVASATSSKSSPTKELTPESYKEEIEKELKKSLRLRLVIPKDSMTSRLRTTFKAMTRSGDAQQANGVGGSDYFGNRGRHVFTPSAVHNSMAKHFRPGQQHDSHELLRTVVDMMKKDQVRAFRLAIMECYGIKKSDAKTCEKNNPKVAELLKVWDRKLYHKTFVDETFGGELVTFQTCLTCQSVRKSYEDFLDLSLPIRVYNTKNPTLPKRGYSVFDDDGDAYRSLEDCLNSFIEPEQLTGSNAVECENCHRLNLEKLAAGANFEEVFPGVKPPAVATTSENIIKSKPVVVEETLETEMDALEPLHMEEEGPAYSNATEDMDDLDEPAVDGILGNTSDMEDEGNDVPPIFLPGESDEKSASSTVDFLNSSEMPNKENVALSLAATQDEGFSESDSSEEKKSASISASSSRNSISEADNVKATVTSKPIPITKCPCSRRQMVWRPPECLTVHLKRFQITSHGTAKLSDRVTFPYILNLTPFCAPHEDELKDLYDEDGEVKYALYGIVEHSGSLHWGHYVAYTKVHGTTKSTDESSETTPDKWFYISDSSVSPSSLESVLGMDPYILFYERIRGQEKKDKLAQLERLNDRTVTNSVSTVSTAVAVPTVEPEPTPSSSSSSTVTNDTSLGEGCSYDFNQPLVSTVSQWAN